MLAPAGNDIQVDFTLDYRILHDAGYNILTYDLRHHGLGGLATALSQAGGSRLAMWWERSGLSVRAKI